MFTCEGLNDCCVNEHILTYNAGVNILAVEYLIKTHDENTYGKYVQALGEVCDSVEVYSLHIDLSLNAHINNLGEMITQGDYDYQKRDLLYFLDDYIKRRDGTANVNHA